MVRIIKGDITTGGVDGAIHRAAGPKLLAECAALGGCATGDARITKGYNLPARHVIHAVGPVWRGGDKNEDEQLASCYRTALKLAEENGLKSIAFPCISTGIYHFPFERACKIALREIFQFLPASTFLEEVYCVCFSDSDAETYQGVLDALE